MNGITIDGMEEMEFRRSIEAMLRQGQADDAANKLKTLLKGYAGEGRLLPERFLTVSAQDIRLDGWERLGEKLGEYDRTEMAMSAISIDILDPQGVGARPDERGLLRPVIETSYFSDSAYPFSEADRDDLLDGYSTFGCEWQGNFENIDTTISVEGIDDLYGATVGLENKVASSTKIGSEDVEAGSIGSCYLAVLIHQAIRDASVEQGLPRPLCVLAGSNDAYPFFDAPALTVSEYCKDGRAALPGDALSAAEFDEECEDDAPESAAPGGMASLESLLGMGTKTQEKKPVLLIDPSEADTIERLEMPLELVSEADERLHIMPALDLGASPLPEAAEPPRQDTDAPQSDAGPLDWGLDEPVSPANLETPDAHVPIEFAPKEPSLPSDRKAQEKPAPIDFSAFAAPPPAADETHKPASPIDFGVHKPQAPAVHVAQQPPASFEPPTLPTPIEPPASIEPTVPSVPIEPPALSTSTKPPALSAPTKPPALSAPIKPPALPAPIKPPAPSAPIKPPALSAPTKPPAPSAPIKPPALSTSIKPFQGEEIVPERSPPLTEERMPAPDFGPAEPGGSPTPADWPNPDEHRDGADAPGFPEILAASEIAPTGPVDRLASDDEPVEAVKAVEAGEAESPLDLDQFMQPEEPATEQRASTSDLPTANEYSGRSGDESGDNLPWPATGPARQKITRTEEVRPAGHSIRLKAAGLANKGKARHGGSASAGSSLIPRWMRWIGSAVTWLQNQIARR